MEIATVLPTLLVGAGLGLAAGWSLFSKGKKISASLQSKIDADEKRLQKVKQQISEAEASVKIKEGDAHNAAREIMSEAKIQAAELQSKLEAGQGRLEEKEKDLDKKVSEIEKQRDTVKAQQTEIDDMKEELTDAATKHREALEKVAKLSKEDAKDQLMKEIEVEYSDFYADQIKRIKKESGKDYEEEAKNLMVEAMHRFASEVASESTATIVQLPSDDIKGKIIGKEGRNIIAFEQATGVDIIIDDTPGAIIISGFDLGRRYVAKLAIEKMIKDGRIQPARIEEVVEKQKEEVGKMMLEFGKRAVDELAITTFPQDLLKIIGRLRFRTSYGQNILKHSVEMAHIGRMLAEEIGADVTTVVEGCLLHDIGKALDHEIAGTHVEIGVEICNRFKVRPEVVHCVAAHHEDIPMESPEAFIVAAADAISGARPGSRKESMEAYIKRLKDLEEVAKGFDGVQKAYAISAGREVRVYVDTKKINDLAQEKLAKAITKKIEDELTYPGVIKVNVIREKRVIETAT